MGFLSDIAWGVAEGVADIVGLGGASDSSKSEESNTKESGDKVVYRCEPSDVHSSQSVGGQPHVDFQHKEDYYRDGEKVAENPAGRCPDENNQHVTDSSWFKK